MVVFFYKFELLNDFNILAVVYKLPEIIFYGSGRFTKEK